MGRPSKINKDQAVEQVMNNIWNDGYDASSVKSLSENLGITRSSFYNAFGTRDNLFEQALHLYVQQSPDYAFLSANKTTPILPLLTQVFKNICKVRAADQETRGCMIINTIIELCPSDNPTAKLVTAALLGSVDKVSELLQWAKNSGELPEDTDVETLALSVQNAIIGLNVMCKIVTEEEKLWKTAQHTLKALNLYKLP